MGKPINGVSVRIVDDNMADVPCGNVGELLVAGDQLMSGYAFDEQATQNAFVDMDGKRYVKTGDFFKQDEEGRLFFMGRKKRLIKISGVNVFPTEIERVAKELDYIADCVCIEYRIGNKPFIKLLVEGELSEAQKQGAINHIAKRMSHWNIPKVVQCVPTFPKTKIGKIDIEVLKNEFGKDS